MAGILNAKHRVMDFILTDEGRSQASTGDLQIAYASLSDRDTFYLDAGDLVAEDAQSRIYFEVSQRHQDRIVVESGRTGSPVSFRTADYDLEGEDIAVTPDSPRTSGEVTVLEGSQANEHSKQIVTSITQNFYDNQLIGNTDIFSVGEGFDLSEEKITFNPTHLTPITVSSYWDKNSEYIPPEVEIFPTPINDQKFAHFPQFKFLPPINKETGNPLGLYPNKNQAEILEYSDLKSSLENIPVKEITFSPTSRENNILIQPFEFSNENGSMKKLKIIDFGVFPNESGTSSGVRVFFIGKMVKNEVSDTDQNTYRFLNLFTLELDV